MSHSLSALRNSFPRLRQPCESNSKHQYLVSECVTLDCLGHLSTINTLGISKNFAVYTYLGQLKTTRTKAQSSTHKPAVIMANPYEGAHLAHPSSATH